MNYLSPEEARALNYHVEVLTDLYTHINDVRKQPIHQGQAIVAKKFFNEKKRIIQCQWGRNGGKTETILYVAWVFCLLNPGVEVYIICPEKLQGKKIYWNSKRLQSYGPRKYIEKEMDSELRLVFLNGSQIVIDGCENYEALRGVKPHLVIYDEFQHHNREFHVEVMNPNLLGRDCSLLVMGTPPKRDNFYCEFRKNLLEQIQDGDASRFYMELPTEVNPAINKAELEKTKRQLIKNGDEKVWLREYMGKLILGGEGAVFPTWDKVKHVKSHSVLTAALQNDAHKLRWYQIYDPGSTTCFGVLFAAHNPYTSQLFILGEIYQKDPKRTDAVSMWRQIQEVEERLNPGGKWRRIYDEAAKWFANEIRRHFRVSLSPTQKNRRSKNDDTDDISLIKSIMSAEGALLVSDQLVWFPWEIENYVTDDKGDFPDKDDHLVDCFLYLVAACHFKFLEHGDSLLTKKGDEFYLTKSSAVVQNISTGSNEWSNQVLDDSYQRSALIYDA